MAGFDDSRVDGPDRDLVHAVALDAHEGVVVDRGPGSAAAAEIPLRRAGAAAGGAPGRVAQPRPRVAAVGAEAREVRIGALHSARGREQISMPG